MTTPHRDPGLGTAPTPALTLVVPVCDELPNLDALFQATLPVLEELPGGFEWILVDDGSTDGSSGRLRELAGRDARIRVLHHRRRYGKGAALTTGFRRARGSVIATIDADLQEDPRELPRLLDALSAGYDLVSGARLQRRDPWSKRSSSRLFNALTRLLGGPPLRDINCGFKVYRRELANSLPLEAGRFRLAPLIAHWWGYRVTEVPVAHRERAAGRAHFGGRRFPGALFDLLAVVFLFRYQDRPGHPFLQAGILSFLLGAGITLHLAVRWFLDDFTIGARYPRLAFGLLLLLLGVQLLATGVLGEWLAWRTREGDEHRVREEGARLPGAGEEMTRDLEPPRREDVSS
ncbi:MAG: glycosyltransferase family 2 protein [Planctomycetota bacterium]